MFKNHLVFILILCIWIASCRSGIVETQSSSSPNCQNCLTIDSLVKVIGQPLDSIARSGFWSSRFYVQDSIFEYEGLDTRSITMFSASSPVIIFETNWETPNKVTRIIVLSNSVLARSREPAIGQSFVDIKKHIDKKLLNEFGDGVLGFVDEENSQVCYIMQAPNVDDELYYGVRSLRDIPDTLKLEQIMITVRPDQD